MRSLKRRHAGPVPTANRRTRGRRLLLLAAAAALASPSLLHAREARSWIGPVGGSWSTASNWSPTGVPAGAPYPGGDFAFFAPTGNGTYVFDGDYSVADQLGGALFEPSSGSITITQNNADTELASFQMQVGDYTGTTTYAQSAGINVVDPMGSLATLNGTYLLSGGSLTSPYTAVGDGAVGTFSQSSGSSNLGMIHNGLSAEGYIALSGGTLLASSVNLANAGTGVINQTGGVSNFGAMGFDEEGPSGGTILLSGGSLTASISDIAGDEGAFFSQSGGSSSLGAFTVGDGDADDVATVSFGTVSLSAGALTASTTTVGTAGSSGTISQSGSLSVSSLGTLLIGDGTGSAGTVLLSGGSLSADILSSTGAIVGDGGTALFSQSGGSCDLGSLTVALGSTSFGTVSLTAGTFVANSTTIGNGGNGTFSQSGSLSVSSLGTLLIAVGSTSSGNVSLSGGSLIVNNNHLGIGAIVGDGGIALFSQSGGSSNLGNLTVGDGSTSFGTVSLTGGTLACLAATIGANSGNGTFVQNGSLSVSNFGTIGLTIGSNDGSGAFLLAQGSLTTAELTVGFDGNGNYSQTGGSSSLGTFTIGSGVGFGNGSSANVYLNGGTLTCTSTTIGALSDAPGAFYQVDPSTASLGTCTIGQGAPGTLTLTAGTLSATVTLIGNGANGTFSQSGGFSSLGVATISSTGALALSAGTMDVQKITSAGMLSITGGTLAITGAGSLGSSSISSTGLSITGTGVLDVGSSGLVIEYGNGTSPVGDLSFAHTARNYPAGSIQRYAQTGINGLNWNGTGIISSFAENDPTGLTAVGIVDENDLGIYPNDYTTAGGGNGTWMGQPINDTNNVLVRMTYYGDGNDDGVVNRFDVTALSQGYSGLAGYVGWSDGDYNYDGQINKNDVSLLAQSYVFQGAPLGDAITPAQARYLLALDPDMPANVQREFDAIAAGQTPEPAALSLFAASVGLLARRRSPN